MHKRHYKGLAGFVLRSNDQAAVEHQMNENETVGWAKTVYGSRGREIISPALRDVVEKAAAQFHCPAEFDNKSYLEALYFTEIMLQASVKAVRLFSGPAAEEFFDSLYDPLRRTLERFENEQGSFRMILFCGTKPKLFNALHNRYPHAFQIALAETEETLKHFMVCDGRMARIEEIHPLITPNTPISEIKATVHFNRPELCQFLEQYFDEIWQHLKEQRAERKKATDKLPVSA